MSQQQVPVRRLAAPDLTTGESSSARGLAAADVAVVAVAALCFFWALGLGPIRDTDEALYAAIARDMAGGGSWVIPHLNGVPYIEKPPLLYWLMAMVFKLFGAGAWQARLPDAMAGWLTSVGCLFFGRRLGLPPAAGRFAAVVTATSLGFMLVSRTVLFDPLMTLFWLAAFAFTLLALLEQRRSWLRLAAVAIGLATLTKGPMPVLLLGLVCVVHVAAYPGRWKRGDLLRFYLDPWAIAIFLAVVAPWHIAATRALPGFAYFYFINETVMRFLGTRVPHDFHTGPWWYYGPKLLIGFMQWTGVLFVVALFAPRLQAEGAGPFTARMARNAALILTVFFSSAGDKGAYYLLPVVPLVAWWLGVKLQAARQTSAERGLSALLGLSAFAFGLCAIGALAATWTPWLQAHLWHSGLPREQLEALRLLLAAVAAVSLLAGTLFSRSRHQPALLVYSLLGVLMMAFSTQLSLSKTADISQRDVAARLHALLPRHVAMYSWQTFEDNDASLLLYGFPRLRIIDSVSSDLRFGCRHDPEVGACVSIAEARRALGANRPAAIWVARDRLPAFLATGLGAGMDAYAFKDSVVFFDTRPDSEPPTSSGASAHR